ncbi:hypothetical protein [Aggregatilinea lenta]|uniref:hypothetical protein n=1 Tax=Aggregatilinea lenta TaxID=913108 RepID=UPI0013C2A673|nr:hypothetical protein [Aggregatilinea lenta]
MSNIYAHGFDRDQVAALEALGFTLRSEASVYAGSQLCRFIDFQIGPSLELIEVEDRQAYQDFVPAGMVPYSPGISLAAPGQPDVALAAYERQFFALEPYRLHVPYGESTGQRSPGWHYLNFAHPAVRDTFVWVTAYDEPGPPRPEPPDHANGIIGVVGLLFDLTPGDLACLARLVDAPLEDGVLTVGGVAVMGASAADEHPLGERGKTFPLRAVVLRAASLDAFVGAVGVRQMAFMGRPAALVETNPLAWDLLVVA